MGVRVDVDAHPDLGADVVAVAVAQPGVDAAGADGVVPKLGIGQLDRGAGCGDLGRLAEDDREAHRLAHPLLAYAG
jgi:hypothetical protein